MYIDINDACGAIMQEKVKNVLKKCLDEKGNNKVIRLLQQLK